MAGYQTSRVAGLATCNLCQWAMDFEGNLSRIIESIDQAKADGAKYRVGPELEIPGYGCEDHFNEKDTETHSWEVLVELVESGRTDGIVCDVGMPVTHRGVRYNCRVLLLDRKIIFIRPKLDMANNGNYRETRYFATWKRKREVEKFYLPHLVMHKLGQKYSTIGDGIVRFSDATLAPETCEELFTPAAPHVDLALNGVEIFTNGSGSHHQLRKLNQRVDLMKGATAKAGGVYLYANQQGCDGGRLYYDGCACAVVNGSMVSQSSQFSVRDVEVVTAWVDLEQVDSYRGCLSSMREQASKAPSYPIIEIDFALCDARNTSPSLPIPVKYLCPEEEIARGPACWLWDYLRRSGASGFLLPLSGGADSASVAAIVGCMCQMVIDAVKNGDKRVIGDVKRITGVSDVSSIKSSNDLASLILTTVYMGTVNSSEGTRQKAKDLGEEIGSSHFGFNIDIIITAVTQLFTTITGKTPLFKVHGGSQAENAALQNIQARVRMVFAFLLAQLMPWVQSKGGGFLLVLGSGNVDEALRGYLTKYDCSSADINPIGGISKQDLRKFLRWAADALGYPTLAHIEASPPTAELEPLDPSGMVAQTDEVDMGMTYEELSVFGRLRKVEMYGPVSMFKYLLETWKTAYSPTVIADKVKHFFRQYSINRHKLTVLTPSYHAENYSPDDNRFDHRQFLYNVNWPWQFRAIDKLAAQDQ